MKRILFGSVSALIMATTPTPLLAQDITPVALVFQGYQGFFVEQGVPSSGAFLHAIHFGRVDAKTLVKKMRSHEEDYPPKLSTTKAIYVKSIQLYLEFNVLEG